MIDINDQEGDAGQPSSEASEQESLDNGRTSQHQRDFFASRGFQIFATFLFGILILVLCATLILSVSLGGSSKLAGTFIMTLVTLFGVLITGIFVFMTLRIESGAKKEAQAVAQVEASYQADLAARVAASSEARKVAESVAMREAAKTAKEEAERVAREMSREIARVEAKKEAGPVARKSARSVAQDAAQSVAREAAREVAREVAQEEFERILTTISSSRRR